jgi:glycerol-3-phosphate O-acyltransferase/dihydroxyacetone phosphate acyltransferase
MVIGTVTKRPLFFIAKGILFENKISAFLLRHLNLIPIYRNHETPDKTHLNKDTFNQCYQHFQRNGCLLIFPEGISITERKLRKIQSGAARIALGAEASLGFQMNLKIIPIGMNYSNAHRFQSDLLINIGPAISVADFKTSYETDSFKTAHTLTEKIRLALDAQLVAIQDEEDERLVEEIEGLYQAQLVPQVDAQVRDMQQDFDNSKAIRDTVQYFKAAEPERVEEAKQLIKSYQNDLRVYSLNDAVLEPSQRKSAAADLAGAMLLLILGAPLFLAGFIHNYLPFRIPLWSARFINRRPEYFGSIAYTIGTFTFLIFYTGQIFLFQYFVGDSVLTFLYALFLPASGLFAFRYYKRAGLLHSKLLLFALFYRRQQAVAQLVSRREGIIELLKKSRLDYLASHPDLNLN